jgi:hypothetical protein
VEADEPIDTELLRATWFNVPIDPHGDRATLVSTMDVTLFPIAMVLIIVVAVTGTWLATSRTRRR